MAEKNREESVCMLSFRFFSFIRNKTEQMFMLLLHKAYRCDILDTEQMFLVLLHKIKECDILNTEQMFYLKRKSV